MSRRAKGLGAALLSVVLASTVSPVTARPPTKPGPVSDLVLSATKPNGAFAVRATWSPGARATRYAVRLSSAGVTLDSGSVTGLAWTGHTTVADGTRVKVTVTPFNGRRKGEARSASMVLPDLTPPVASYSVTHDPARWGPNVTVTADSLWDNMTPRAGIVQTIAWGDGQPAESWPTENASISHTYPDTEKRYEASVTVKDAANNQRSYPLVIVVRDLEAPTGSFALPTASAWAGWTKVRLSQAAIHDNLSPDDKIARVISWGDGAQTVWAQGTTPAHVYAAAGSYAPTVQLTDEAGNTSGQFSTSTVVVRVDSVRPTLRLTPPKTRRAYVGSWRPLTGRASDGQTGVRKVTLKAVEKRRGSWFAYQPASKSWVKAASRPAAWRKAGTATVKPTSTGTWSVRVAGLTKGRLVYRARAFDNVANASPVVRKRAVLTRR